MIHIRVLPPLPDHEVAPDGLFHLPGSVNFIGEHEWYLHIACDLQPGEDSQYPLEDVLDEYMLSVHSVPGQGDAWVLPNSGKLDLVVAGQPDDLRRCMADIVGKQAPNLSATPNSRAQVSSAPTKLTSSGEGTKTLRSLTFVCLAILMLGGCVNTTTHTSTPASSLDLSRSSFLEYKRMYEEGLDLPVGTEVRIHDTPNGGVFSVAFFTDDTGRSVPKDEATNVEIHECDEDGQSIHRTYMRLE